MARVSQETLDKLNEFFNTLPGEARSKCALCNETLTHIVKSAEAKTGAPTATVTRELADRINDGASPGDVVEGEKLRNRVRNQEREFIRVNHPNKPAPEPPDTSGLTNWREKKAAEESGKNEGSMRIIHYEKKNVSQKMAWGKVVRDLEKLTNYMMGNCETPADIPTETKDLFLYYVNTLQYFLNELERGVK